MVKASVIVLASRDPSRFQELDCSLSELWGTWCRVRVFVGLRGEVMVVKQHAWPLGRLHRDFLRLPMGAHDQDGGRLLGQRAWELLQVLGHFPMVGVVQLYKVCSRTLDVRSGIDHLSKLRYLCMERME